MDLLDGLQKGPTLDLILCLFFVSYDGLGVPSFPSLTPLYCVFLSPRRCSSQPRQYKKDYDLHNLEGSMIPFERGGGRKGIKKRKTQKKRFPPPSPPPSAPIFKSPFLLVRCKRRAIYLFDHQKIILCTTSGGFFWGTSFQPPFFIIIIIAIIICRKHFVIRP